MPVDRSAPDITTRPTLASARLVLLAFGIVAGPLSLSGQAPSPSTIAPPSTLIRDIGAPKANTNSTFSSATEALAMLLQVVGNLEGKVQAKELDSIHSEDVILSASVTALLQQASRLEPTQREPFRAEFVKFSQHVAALHLAGDTRREAVAIQEMQQVQETFERIKGYFSDAVLASARTLASVYVCSRHRDVHGTSADTCPKCGAPLDQQSRILPAFCGLPTPSTNPIRAVVRTEAPLSTGTTVKAFLQLTRADRAPVYASDLIVSHTERIHLLIIDAGLTDYQHEHPHPTRVAGEYVFSFTPRKPGPYRIWADLRAHPLGLQEYAMTMVPADGIGLPIDHVETNQVTLDGLQYQLTFPFGELHVGRPAPGRLHISRPDGSPFTQLEPVMDSFAHLVAFHEDGQTIMHLHPKGPPITSPNARGGPELEFQLFATKPGFVRLFAQVQIGGVSRFAPFGLRIVW